MNPEKLHVGIIGVGRWGKILLKEFDAHTHVTWCAHRGDEITKKFLNENYPGVHTTTSYEEMFTDPSLDIVVIATPTETHFEIAKKALESHKHVFLEKPGCSTTHELEELCTLADTENLSFMIGYEFAHHPALMKLKEIIAHKKINFIHTEWFKWGTFNDHALPHLLSHEISILKILGAEDIYTTSYRQEKGISDSDIVSAEFETTIGNVISTINRISPEKRKTVTIHTDTDIYIWNNNDLFTSNTSDKTLIPIPLDPLSPVSAEIKNFLSSIIHKEKSMTDGRFALDVLKTIEAISLR